MWGVTTAVASEPSQAAIMSKGFILQHCLFVRMGLGKSFPASTNTNAAASNAGHAVYKKKATHSCIILCTHEIQNIMAVIWVVI